jgi:hypothetical protein
MFAALLAAVAVSIAPAAEPPPPPYDWDGVAQDFAPFRMEVPGGTEQIIWALHPAEGRALCEYERKYAQLGPLDCVISPIPDSYTFGPDGLITDPVGEPGITVTVG